MTKKQEECPYCSDLHRKDLYNAEGSDYTLSLYIYKSTLHVDTFSWDGDYSDEIKINYCPKCRRRL